MCHFCCHSHVGGVHNAGWRGRERSAHGESPSRDVAVPGEREATTNMPPHTRALACSPHESYMIISGIFLEATPVTDSSRQSPRCHI